MSFMKGLWDSGEKAESSESSEAAQTDHQAQAWQWISGVSSTIRCKVEKAATEAQKYATEAVQEIREGDYRDWIGAEKNETTVQLAWEDPNLFGDELANTEYDFDDVANELKVRAHHLSNDTNMFDAAPPPSFEFSMAANLDKAKRLLETDPVLASRRFTLVPRDMTEDIFWKTYFWKLSDVIESMRESIKNGSLEMSIDPFAVDEMSSDGKGIKIKSYMPGDEKAKTEAPGKKKAGDDSSPGEEGDKTVERSNSLDEALKEFASSSEDDDDTDEEKGSDDKEPKRDATAEDNIKRDDSKNDTKEQNTGSEVKTNNEKH
eukprot:Selendium_serpulae@DN6267_c3_g4_i3.p1